MLSEIDDLEVRDPFEGMKAVDSVVESCNPEEVEFLKIISFILNFCKRIFSWIKSLNI